MAVTVTFHKQRIFKYDVLGNHTDVVKVIEWAYEFSDGTSTVAFGGETVLYTDALPDTITPIDQLTDAEYDTWVRNSFGDDWDQIVAGQIKAVEDQTQKASLTKYFEAPNAGEI